jgi:predicted HNH restriction endonuclease
MLSEFIKESKEFGPKEDNPLIYTLVIAKIATSCKETAKEDEKLFAVIDKVEKMLPKIDTKRIKADYSPIGLFGVMENRKGSDVREYVKQYFETFEALAADDEKSFSSAYEVHHLFKELKDSNEFKDFLKSL